MVYFFPIIPAVDPGPDGSGGGLLEMLLMVNLFFNGIPCVLTALALWRTARWQGIQRPWLALVPVADLWVLGSLSDRYNQQVRNREKKMRRHLPLWGIAALAGILLLWIVLSLGDTANMDPTVELLLVIGGLSGIVAVWGVFLVNRIMALCDLYTGFARGKPWVYIVFSVVCPPLIPLFIFKCHW